jgi:hypothetical protein
MYLLRHDIIGKNDQRVILVNEKKSGKVTVEYY